MNFLKTGIEYATIVSTYSPAMAERVKEIDRGYGLEEVFRRRTKELVGIANGIDYAAWDPANDPLLPGTYSIDDKTLLGKRKCKAALQSSLSLDSGPRTLLAAAIGRFDADSGFDVFGETLTAILERNIELVLMGTGPAEIVERIRTMESSFAGRCRFIDGYHAATAHTLVAGADLLIMPAPAHPSNSLGAIAQRYGTVPIAYSRSGLEDTIVDLAADLRAGTGVFFEPYGPGPLLEAVDLARKLYKDAAKWKQIVFRCLKQDFSWEATAAEYMKAYRRVTRRTKGKLAK